MLILSKKAWCVMRVLCA